MKEFDNIPENLIESMIIGFKCDFFFLSRLYSLEILPNGLDSPFHFTAGSSFASSSSLSAITNPFFKC